MRSQKMLIAIATCLCLSVIVSAHPGRTDSNGGHFDHGSGGYHYHHGYSAHQHSDMDGDGNLDCPYLFDDKTVSDSDDTAFSEIKNESKNETTKKITNLDYIRIGICLLFAISFIKGLIQLAVDEIKKRHNKQP